MFRTEDLNIESCNPLISPILLKKDIPLSEKAADTVAGVRESIAKILSGEDSRMIAIVGPCSIHQTEAALEYTDKLVKLKELYKDKLLLLMRVYFEKPRTTIGWKGLIPDPDLDGTDNLQKGLFIARSLMSDINEKGLGVASEMLDPIVPQYISDLIGWAAIGARTTESQTHREIASGLSMPVGFKNGTDGSLQSAINGIVSARSVHSFIGIDQHGRTSVLNTRGNVLSHLILRGGSNGPNYHEEDLEQAEKIFRKTDIDPVIIVDCSHANSGKKAKFQSRVLRSIISQRQFGRQSIKGFMLESNLKFGNQKVVSGVKGLEYGVSITDECIGWEETADLLGKTAEAL